jgi:1,2-diacylglycerol 3-beta-glucosyltransferase
LIVASLSLNLISLALALPAVLSTGYLLLLTLLSRSLPARHPRSRLLRFDIIVPAHNEAQVIARTVTSLRGIEWPADRFRILVCADNCTDATAECARAAGAQVIERHNPEQRGKGYALDFAFRTSRQAMLADAVVVVDADTEVSSNLLEAIAARLEEGAQAVQVHYGVLNPLASWRTRLITIAKGAVHIVRSRARERLGVSCGVRGTGWCVTHHLLQVVPYRAFSLTEDVEYGIDLGLAGFRVAYADEADCNGEMASGEQSARSQRQRWERGRFQLMRSKTGLLLRTALRRRSAVCLDLALDLLVLPLSYVALTVVALMCVAAVGGLWVSDLQPWLRVGAICTAALVCYVLRGWQLSGIGLRGVLDLARAPTFLLWKLHVLIRGRKSTGWERTERERIG